MADAVSTTEADLEEGQYYWVKVGNRADSAEWTVGEAIHRPDTRSWNFYTTWDDYEVNPGNKGFSKRGWWAIGPRIERPEGLK